MVTRIVIIAALLLNVSLSNHVFAVEKSKAIETDERLHPDGKGWRVDQAKIKDSSRPRVLLVGDSILNGYVNLTIKSLSGIAYVDAWVNPLHQSTHYNKQLGDVLDKGPYDVVHINTGLHGWQKGRIKEGSFKPLTRAFIKLIKEKNPKARIIWASSTPVTVKSKPLELDPEINPVVIEHNRMAAEVMKEEKVAVNDFYSLLVDKRELARGDQFHWKGTAYKMLNTAVTNAVIIELKNSGQLHQH